ncbi:MAG: phage minor head protein [Patescibacteria group bacterium]|jgi:hypothetical protein
MIETKTYSLITTQATREGYDPTHTLVLRNMFARDMRSRFNELINIIRRTVIDEDCFGLDKYKAVTIMNDPQFVTHQMQTSGQGAFAFSRSDVKLTQFMKWLEEQVNKGVIDVLDLQQVGSSINGAWTNMYVFDSYKRGIIRARSELRKAGYNVPSIDDTGGIGVSMNTPFHLERLGLLYTRVYSELKGITVEMDNKISRILAQGLADGDNPILLARKITSVIGDDLSLVDSLGRFIPARRRAETLARTEVIRAHHLGNVQEMRNWGVEGVMVEAEFVTAGDKQVCSRCFALAKGGPYTLDQIEKMIPAHPKCRCCAIPINVKYIMNKN